jgi:hypothetical protein
MKAFMDELMVGHVTRPRRTALKAALSTSRLAEFQTHLDSAKLTLNTYIGITSLLFSLVFVIHTCSYRKFGFILTTFQTVDSLMIFLIHLCMPF